MLAISGADLIGKSTFARRCVELLQGAGFSHMLHHLSRPPAQWDYYENYLERMSINSVWDRFHLDSLPYRSCDDHQCSMTPLKFSLVEAAFRQHCGFQVVLYASDDEIRERHAERGDPMYSLDHILRVNAGFVRLANVDGADTPYECRGAVYRPQVDACGCVTNKFGASNLLTPERVTEMYVERLREFSEL